MPSQDVLDDFYRLLDGDANEVTIRPAPVDVVICPECYEQRDRRVLTWQFGEGVTMRLVLPNGEAVAEVVGPFRHCGACGWAEER